MRRPLIGLAVALGCSLLAPSGRAQVLGTGLNDPFSFYYGFYLPHQAAIAAQPTPMDTINAVTAARQFAAPTNRNGIFDPVSPYGNDDDLFVNGSGGGRGRSPSQMAGQMGPGASSNARGTGPALYYGRTARYFPQLRTGRNPNRNMSVESPRRPGGGVNMYGGLSVPSMPGGF